MSDDKIEHLKEGDTISVGVEANAGGGSLGIVTRPCVYLGPMPVPGQIAYALGDAEGLRVAVLYNEKTWVDLSLAIEHGLVEAG